MVLLPIEGGGIESNHKDVTFDLCSEMILDQVLLRDDKRQLKFNFAILILGGIEIVPVRQSQWWLNCKPATVSCGGRIVSKKLRGELYQVAPRAKYSIGEEEILLRYSVESGVRDHSYIDCK